MRELWWTAIQGVQGVKALAAELDDLSSLPGTHTGELTPGSRPLTATHAVASGHCPCVRVHACAYTRIDVIKVREGLKDTHRQPQTSNTHAHTFTHMYTHMTHTEHTHTYRERSACPGPGRFLMSRLISFLLLSGFFPFCLEDHLA